MYGVNRFVGAAYVSDVDPHFTRPALMSVSVPPLPAHRLVAIVDDDPLVRSAMANLMRSIGYESEQFSGPVAFLREDLGRFGCVISDMQMPDMSGLDLQTEIVLHAPDLPIIFMTAYPEEWARNHALKRGARGWFEKPCDLDGLVRLLETVTGGPKAGGGR